MAWTAPRTWVAGETVTASLLNVHLRDNLKAIGDAWTAYTPAWTGATTNPVLNNGTMGGAWMQAGKLTMFRITITMGSTTTYGTGQWRLTLPSGKNPTAGPWSFDMHLRDASAGSAGEWRGRGVWNTTGSYLELWTAATVAGNNDRAVATGVPFAWATSDVVMVTGGYEAA